MPSIELPWPPKLLWPNQTERWGAQHTKRTQRRAARTLGWGLTAAQIGSMLRKWDAPEAGLPVSIIAQPPMRPGPTPDEDNLKGALKHYLDGIADALGVNDRQFRFAPIAWQPKQGAGKIIISF